MKVEVGMMNVVKGFANENIESIEMEDDTMIDNCTVGKNIASLRQAKGMTQQQLAAVMNVSHQAVSKWENGAALPDIQTLLELTQLFGVTVEQLLNDDISQSRLKQEEKRVKHSVKEIGNYVNEVFNDIGNMFKAEPKETPCEEDAAQTSVDSKSEETKANIDIKNLIEMAPFMSKSAVGEMLKNCHQKLTIEEISALAPFVDSACLERLIRESEQEINWDTLRRLAPFLKKEVVDAFARMIAMGGKYVRPVSVEVNKTAEDVYKTIDHVSRKIGAGMDKAVRKVVRVGNDVVNEVSRAFDDLTTEPTAREDRLGKLRRAAFEKALEEGKWDWIEAHVHEIADADLKQQIVERAYAMDMREWVGRNLPDYADDETVDHAIQNDEWDWLGKNLSKFDALMQQRVAIAAKTAQRWQWLMEYADRLPVGEYVVEIADSARKSGEKDLAVQLIRYAMESESVCSMTMMALDDADMGFIDLYMDVLSQDHLQAICRKLIETERWQDALKFAGRLNLDNIEWMMESAIQAGNFDMIDALDELLNQEKNENVGE